MGHSNVVRNATGLYLPKDAEQDLIVVTLSTDSSIKIWNRKENEGINITGHTFLLPVF